MTRPQDEYEARYVRSGEQLLHRERSVQKFHWILLAQWVIALVAGVGVAISTALAAWPVVLMLLGFAAVLFLVWATLSVLRVHVTPSELTIKLGPFGPRIPLDAIESCAVIPRPRGRYRGGATRLEADGTWSQSYMMTNDHAEMVEVLFRRDGKRIRVHLTSEDSARLVREVEAARALRRASEGAGARIAGEAADGADEALAEQEAAHALEDQGRVRREGGGTES